MLNKDGYAAIALLFVPRLFPFPLLLRLLSDLRSLSKFTSECALTTFKSKGLRPKGSGSGMALQSKNARSVKPRLQAPTDEAVRP